jgi:hypothetical protein
MIVFCMRFFFLVLFLIANQDAIAFKAFFKQYQEHPRALKKADCSICHFNKRGGGKLQAIGIDFAEAEYNITQEIIDKYPEKFRK